MFVRDQIGIDGEVASASGQRFNYRFAAQDFPAFEIGVLGGFQFNNAAIAVTLFLRWLRESRPQTTSAAIDCAIRSGLRETRWPGRLEVIEKYPLIVIDVGHTPDGIKQSLTSLRSIHGTDGWILVTGASTDKKADEIVRALAPSFAPSSARRHITRERTRRPLQRRCARLIRTPGLSHRHDRGFSRTEPFARENPE